MGGGAAGIERRTAVRYGCAGDAEIVVPGRGLRYAGKIGNLSAGGCFIEAQCSLERGTSVEIWMNAEGQPLRVAANLLARREGGAGFRFHSLTPRKLEQIRGLVAELAEAEAARDNPDAGPLEKIEEQLCGRSPGLEREHGGVLRRLVVCLASRLRRWAMER